MKPRTLFVVADDGGLSPEVDAGILDCVRAGSVRSVDLFVNPPFEPDPDALSAAGAGLGLHLNLTHGRPCAGAEEVGSLLDGRGALVGERATLLAQFRLRDAELECRRQVRRFYKLVGHAPCHLSFHKHLHAHDRRLLRLGMELARECGAVLRTVDAATRGFCRSRGVPTTDRFLGEVRPAPYWTLGRLTEQLAGVGAGTTELMCHPGRGVKPIDGLWYLCERDTERETFCSREGRLLLAAFRCAPCTAATCGGRV